LEIGDDEPDTFETGTINFLVLPKFYLITKEKKSPPKNGRSGADGLVA